MAASFPHIPGSARALHSTGPAVVSAVCIQALRDLLLFAGANVSNRAPGETVMAKGQMRSNKEKKKPKADKNLKKGAAAANPFAAGKTAAGQSPNKKS